MEYIVPKSSFQLNCIILKKKEHFLQHEYEHQLNGKSKKQLTQ